VTIEYNGINLSILSIYLPKGPDDNNTEWIRTYKSDKNTKVLITGDFNTHSPFWENNCEKTTSNRFLENIIDSPFYLLNDGRITRIPDNSAHRPTAIDLTLVSPDLAPICVWLTLNDNLNSDHIP